MTTRHAAYLVVLEEDVREDDEATLNALRMVKGVLDVKPAVEADYAAMVARSRVGAQWRDALFKVVQELS